MVEDVFRKGEATTSRDERAGMMFENRVVPVRHSPGNPRLVAVYASDISERTMLEGMDRLTHELDQHVLRGESWDELMRFLCREIVRILHLPLAWVGKHDAHGHLRAVASAGTAEPCLVKLIQFSAPCDLRKSAIGPAHAAFCSGRSQSARVDDPVWTDWAGIVEPFRIQASFAIPLIVRGKVEGVYTLYADHAGTFDTPAIRTRLERLTDHLSLTLEMAMDQQRMRLLNDALVAAGNPTFITDREGSIVWTNQAFLNLSGYAMQDMVGQNPRILQSGQQDASYYRQLWDTISQGEPWSRETVNRRKDGGLYTVQQTITPILGPDGTITHYVSIHEDITTKKATEERIAHQAHHDSLTGLPNRRLLMDRLNQAMAGARRGDHGLALLFLDLDGFKAVNDRLGHLAGDRLLQEVARRLGAQLRESDTLARLGGDEFTILLPATRRDEDIGPMASKVIHALGQPFEIDGESVRIGTSIGIARWPEHASSPDDLIAVADQAMYSAKKAGRGVYRIAPSLDKAAGEPLSRNS